MTKNNMREDTFFEQLTKFYVHMSSAQLGLARAIIDSLLEGLDDRLPQNLDKEEKFHLVKAIVLGTFYMVTEHKQADSDIQRLMKGDPNDNA